MKTQNHDVIMICKRHYDMDEHDSTIAALREYYKREYAMEEQFTTNMNIFKVLLMPVAEEHFHASEWKEILLDLFSASYDIKRGLCYPADGTRDEMFNHVFSKVVTAIELFQVRDGNGNWIIDLSGYKNGEKII